jgi:uncharacterized protein (DUF1501 family)
MYTRRHFLKGAGAALTAFALPLAPRVARAAQGEPALVVLYLRGAADGLNLVIPTGDPYYYALRPDIQVAPGSEVALGGFYGLHPALAALQPLYAEGDLAFVHAAGSPDGTRSHFKAQDYMELAAPGNPGVGDGWLNRTLSSLGAPDIWTGISIGPASVLALSGASPSLAMSSIEGLVLEASDAQRATLEAMYAAPANDDLARASQEAFEAIDVIGTVPTESEVDYPAGGLGEAMRDAAALLRADIGVRVLAVDVGGWDHHEGEVGALSGVAPPLAGSIAAFRDDLGSHWERTCVLAMTEFGRTAAQNGSAGTDHGHGSVMFAAGGGVAGGRVITKDDVWPGLAPGDLHEGRDLAVTTDFRDVFAEVLHRHLGIAVAGVSPILPGHPVDMARFPGLFG